MASSSPSYAGLCELTPQSPGSSRYISQPTSPRMSAQIACPLGLFSQTSRYSALGRDIVSRVIQQSLRHRASSSKPNRGEHLRRRAVERAPPSARGCAFGRRWRTPQVVERRLDAAGCEELAQREAVLADVVGEHGTADVQQLRVERAG